jgi:phenylalanyl-tRNA synthetase beta subunit
MPTRAKRHVRPSAAPVIDLEAFRGKDRLRRCRERVLAVLEQNRRSVQRLFESGLVFTRHGSGVGRDLLRSYQNLRRVADALDRAQAGDERHALRTPADAADLFADVELLLEKSSALARRHRALFSAEHGEL